MTNFSQITSVVLAALLSLSTSAVFAQNAQTAPPIAQASQAGGKHFAPARISPLNGALQSELNTAQGTGTGEAVKAEAPSIAADHQGPGGYEVRTTEVRAAAAAAPCYVCYERSNKQRGVAQLDSGSPDATASNPQETAIQATVPTLVSPSTTATATSQPLPQAASHDRMSSEERRNYKEWRAARDRNHQP